MNGRHEHTRILSVTPLAPGWRLVTKTYDKWGPDRIADVGDPNPIAALAHIQLWYCYASDCPGPFECDHDRLELIQQGWYPVWARGFSYVGDGFDLDTDEREFITILGPGEPFDRDELRKRLPESKEQTG
jgi:hypothetical protein